MNGPSSTLSPDTTTPAGTARGALAIDARGLYASGIGRYLREILACWLHAPPLERLVLLGDPDALRDFVRAHEPAMQPEIVPHVGAFYGLTAQRSWHRVRRDPRVRGAAATFFPHWDAPWVGLPRRSVVVLQDLIHLRVPEAFPWGKRVVARRVLARVLGGAAAVVCPTRATAADARQLFPRVASRLHIVPLGVAPAFVRPGAGVASGALPSALDAPFLLAVGNLKPHKNLEAAVAVVARLRAELPAAEAPRLVVIGRQYPEFDVRDVARRAGVADAVVVLGEVDDATLHACYAGAAALLFPSRYEGFGLPVAEAMCVGTPVIASSTPAVAEVVGDAAPTFAPDDVAGMASAARLLLADPRARAAWAARGRARVAPLSWARTAAETARVVREVAATAPVNLPA